MNARPPTMPVEVQMETSDMTFGAVRLTRRAHAGPIHTLLYRSPSYKIPRNWFNAIPGEVKTYYGLLVTVVRFKGTEYLKSELLPAMKKRANTEAEKQRINDYLKVFNGIHGTSIK